MDDLIKKLENIEVPEIETPEHKKALKTSLLNSKYFKPRGVLNSFRKPILIGVPTTVMALLLAVFIIQPKIIEAKALRIARENPEVQTLIQQGIHPSQIKIKNNKAYILFTSSISEEPIVLRESEQMKETAPFLEIERKVPIVETNEIMGVVVEVNLKEKKVARLRNIRGEDILSLTQAEKEQAKKIIEKEELIREILPKAIKIEKIEPAVPAGLRLIEKGKEIEVVSSAPESEKKAKVHLLTDHKKWIVEVNLNKKTVEKMQFLPTKETP